MRTPGVELDAVRRFFGFANWPDGIVPLDLGGRVLDVIPIPGHQEASIALYDRATGILLTGDTLYPGRLYVTDVAAFRRSIDRVIDFTKDKPVAHILGTHIEQSATPFVDYPRGTQYQPVAVDPASVSRQGCPRETDACMCNQRCNDQVSAGRNGTRRDQTSRLNRRSVIRLCFGSRQITRIVAGFLRFRARSGGQNTTVLG